MSDHRFLVPFSVSFVLAVAGFATAACQGAAPPNPAAAPDAGGTLLPSAGGEASALDGTLTITTDVTNGSGASTNERHEAMTVTVHLLIKDGGPGFKDAGSTYTYSGTSRSDDPQTQSSCGLHTESSGSGGGSFSSPGLIVGYYGNNNPEVQIGIHAPYTDDGKSVFLCNGLTTPGTTEGVAIPSCGDPAGGALVGTIEPGGVMAPAAGQVIDFTCSEPFAIGTGSTVVKGTLTSR